MIDYLEKLRIFMEHGGGVLWAIMVLSVLMWVLILERYLYFYTAMPQLSIRLHGYWAQQLRQCSFDQGQYVITRIRDAYAADFASRLRRFLHPIRVLSTALPLLGLLGTVSGMIKTFDAMTLFGSGNVRAMATGISQALFTTMAGLVTALSGVYFSAHLDSRARLEIQRFRNSLRNDA
jgi:biopolymer transport protein ExbB